MTTERTEAEQLEDLGDIDRSNKIGRTAVQVTGPGAIVVIGTWFCGLLRIDLDPGPGMDMPANVVAAWIVVATIAGAWWMNRRKT